MQITINGKACACEKGEFLLEIARRNNIPIPTLCHHPSLSEQGCCRVCIVEVVEKGWSKVVVSCVYPVEKEIEVFTNSEKIKRERALILSLLQKRAPDSRIIAGLAKSYGAPELPSLKPLDSGKCVLCGLCARACASLGTGAISTVSRGITKAVSTPYDEPSKDCVGCGSCAAVCPTGEIVLAETAESRTIWGKTFLLVRCGRCGVVLGTKEELERAARQAGGEVPTLCPNCRRLAMTDEMAHTYGI